MKTRTIVSVLLIAGAISAGSLFIGERFMYAQGSSGTDQAILAKLDAALRNQSAILSDLASIKEELKIIKIRVTQSQ